MVRTLKPAFDTSQRFSPHAWGWSVRRSSGYVPPCWFSPHAWGWSEQLTIAGRQAVSSPHTRGDGPYRPATALMRSRVLPTRVGMVRLTEIGAAGPAGSPHRVGMVRGDLVLLGRGRRVLPTRVGMVRMGHGTRTTSSRSPHARGDGPSSLTRLESSYSVLPTRVGMVRDRRAADAGSVMFSPRAWGWSVRLPRHESTRVPFSPRAWGWSERQTMRGAHRRQFSPRAWGWSEQRVADADRATGSPHARGDGPPMQRRARVRGDVLPTRVGMVRDVAAYGNSAMTVLPTRVGMVRGRCTANPVESMFSPRAWGWSVTRRHGATVKRSPHARGDGPSSDVDRTVAVDVLPTRVGMVRTVRHGVLLQRMVLPTRVGMVRIGITARYAVSTFSPRAWGWSARRSANGLLGPFSPHAWGWSETAGRDGELRTTFSPRAWGWSARDCCVELDARRSPHRVGMVRHRGETSHAAVMVLPTRVGMVRRRVAGRAVRVGFSPHAWGWSARSTSSSAARPRSPHARGDGPYATLTSSRPYCSPHARGDGPAAIPCSRSPAMRSPHARGDGPDPVQQTQAASIVLPTRVGMVRAIARTLTAGLRFSPRAWGWSVAAISDHA